MRIAFVSVPRYPCAIEVARQPQLAGQALIVADEGQPRRVLDCSPECSPWRVQRGMTVRKALGLCPQAVLLPDDPVLYRSLWEAAILAFSEITPEIEDEEMGSAYLNVTGLQAYYADEQQLAQHIIEAIHGATGLEASAGIARGKMPASAAAAIATAGTALIVPEGKEAAFLADRAIDLLPLGQEVVSRLRLLGIETLGEVAQLSIPELQSQFGLEGKRLWQLANGIEETPFCPRPQFEALAGSFIFEAPVSGIDVMLAVAKQLFSRLQPALRGRAARGLTLQAELTSGRGWERRTVLREAVSEEQRLLFILRASLNNFPPPQAIRSLTLRLDGLSGETGKQLSLGDRSRLQRQLEETIRQLKARYGYSPVYRCVDVEPWSVVPEERQILVESDV